MLNSIHLRIYASEENDKNESHFLFIYLLMTKKEEYFLLSEAYKIEKWM